MKVEGNGGAQEYGAIGPSADFLWPIMSTHGDCNWPGPPVYVLKLLKHIFALHYVVFLSLTPKFSHSLRSLDCMLSSNEKCKHATRLLQPPSFIFPIGELYTPLDQTL